MDGLPKSRAKVPDFVSFANKNRAEFHPAYQGRGWIWPRPRL